MIDVFLGQIWPYVLGALAILAAWLSARRSGKLAAHAEDAVHRAQKKEKTDKEVRNVRNEVASLDDDTVDRELDRWVRNR
ncbi:hypothetical protein ACMHYO_16250 [Allopusillimonas ginsengisoli]|uniref:hypothetical protein n=1 Tax=Allopusillimonas ginsengisoli TaxID=453575 RepID=UPI0039C0362E